MPIRDENNVTPDPIAVSPIYINEGGEKWLATGQKVFHAISGLNHPEYGLMCIQSQGTNAGFRPVDCNKKFPYVCVKVDPESCPEDYPKEQQPPYLYCPEVQYCSGASGDVAGIEETAKPLPML